MKRGIKALAVLAALVAASAGPQAFAFCDSGRETPAIFQCAERAWFEPLPAGAGSVSGVFWGIGFGNGEINDGQDSRGVGVSGKSTFNGNDSGIAGLDILDAGSVIPGAPVGSVCLGSNNWANAGVDGCCDNPRDAYLAFTDDDLLNPEFDVQANRTGYPGVPSSQWIQDAPMGVLLSESSGQYFALLAVASMVRNGPTDLRPGSFNLADVSNGSANPLTGVNNVVPWQSVPGTPISGDPTTEFVRSAVVDANNNRVLDLGWKGAVLYHDGSSKPSTNSVVTGLPGITGMGVTDHPDLVRYVLESQAIVDPNDPLGSLNPAGWSVESVTQVPDGSGGFTAQITVAPDTCLRLHTYFGLVPQTAVISTPNCRQGICGDVGIDLESAPACIGGALAADGLVKNARAVRDRGAVDVSFESQSELSVRNYKIYALTKQSGLVEVASLSCSECTTGGGGQYKVRIPMGQLKGARELEIVSSTGSRERVSIK